MSTNFFSNEPNSNLPNQSKLEVKFISEPDFKQVCDLNDTSYIYWSTLDILDFLKQRHNYAKGLFLVTTTYNPSKTNIYEAPQIKSELLAFAFIQKTSNNIHKIVRFESWSEFATVHFLLNLVSKAKTNNHKLRLYTHKEDKDLHSILKDILKIESCGNAKGRKVFRLV